MARRKTKPTTMSLYREFLEHIRAVEEQTVAEIAQEQGQTIPAVRAFFRTVESSDPAIREAANKRHARALVQQFIAWLDHHAG